MTLEVSPAPSDLPVRKDEADNGDGNDHDMNIESEVITIIEENQPEEGNSDEDDSAEDDNIDDAYCGYVALDQEAYEDEQQQTEFTSLNDKNDGNSVPESSSSSTKADVSSEETENLSSNPTETSECMSEIFQISDSHAEKIKQAMAGFKLPTHNIPEWAKVVPEDNWKSKLLDSIAKKQE